jgi:hypothetical protein
MSATSTRRTILAGAATLRALTVPALAVPATSGCTLPADLIERLSLFHKPHTDVWWPAQYRPRSLLLGCS